MELIDNKSKTLSEDLSVEIRKGSKLSIAAACFSIYAFQELKEQLSSVSRGAITKYLCSVAVQR